MTNSEPLKADAVRNATFETVRLTAGYDMYAVDKVLDRLATTLTSYEFGVIGDRLTAAELESLDLTQVKLREGYKIPPVDDLLAQAAATLRTYEAGPPRVTTPPEATPAATARPAVPPQVPAAPSAIPTNPGVPANSSAVPSSVGSTSEAVRDAQFTTVRLIAGYDMSEVDDILDRLIATLASYESGVAGARLSSAELESLAITQTKLREGYKVREVDELLEQVAKDLRSYEGLPSRGSVSGPAGGVPASGEGRRAEHGSYSHADRAITPATGRDAALTTNVDVPGAGRHTSTTAMPGDTSASTMSPGGAASTPGVHSAPDGSAFSPVPDPRTSGQSNSTDNGFSFGAATPEQSGPESAGLGATGSAAAGAFFSKPAHGQPAPDAGAASPAPTKGFFGKPAHGQPAPDAGAASPASTNGFFGTPAAPQAPAARRSSNAGAAAAQTTNNTPQGLDPAAFIRQLMEEHKLQAPGGDPMPVLIRTPDSRTYAVKAVELTPNGLVVTVGE